MLDIGIINSHSRIRISDDRAENAGVTKLDIYYFVQNARVFMWGMDQMHRLGSRKYACGSGAQC